MRWQKVTFYLEWEVEEGLFLLFAYSLVMARGEEAGSPHLAVEILLFSFFSWYSTHWNGGDNT